MKNISITNFRNFTPVEYISGPLYIPAFLNEEYNYCCYKIANIEVSDKILKRVIRINDDFIILFTRGEKIDLELSKTLLEQLSPEYTKESKERLSQYVINYDQVLELKHKEIINGFEKLPIQLATFWYLRAPNRDEINKKIIEKLKASSKCNLSEYSFKEVIDKQYLEMLYMLKRIDEWYPKEILSKMPLLMCFSESDPIIKIYTKEGISTLGQVVPKFLSKSRYLSGSGVVLDFLDIKPLYFCNETIEYSESDSLEEIRDNGSRRIAFDTKEKKYLISSGFLEAFLNPSLSIRDYLSEFLLGFVEYADSRDRESLYSFIQEKTNVLFLTE